MAEFLWYATPLDANGTATADSEIVKIWFAAEAPDDPSEFDLIIIDSNGDGLISRTEWTDATGGGPTAFGLNGGSVDRLFDGEPGGVGTLYSPDPFEAGDTNLTGGLISNFPPVDPNFLVICFAAGTLIDTPEGPRAVETLAEADIVLTADHGPVAIRALWSRSYAGAGRYAPVEIAAGALGEHDALTVSQNHRVLVRGGALEAHFAMPEALVMAKSLVDGEHARLAPCERVTYYHLMLDRHAIIFANGLPAETMFPGSHVLGKGWLPALDAALFAADDGEAAAADTRLCRPALSHREGQLLASALWPARETAA